MKKSLIISALPEELSFIESIKNVPIIYSGVGKINASISAMMATEQGYTKIINIGSSGSKKHKVGTIHKIGVLYQDIDCTPLCDYGLTYNEKDDRIDLEDGNEISCFTTDYFYDILQNEKYSNNYLKAINKFDFFDMESYAIAKVCKRRNVDFVCYKWVSDDGDGELWEDNKSITFESIKTIIDSEFEN